MFKKMNDKAQGSSLLLLLIMFFIIMFVFGNPAVQAAFINFGNAVFSPIIGFGGKYPVLTVFCAGLIVVLLSSLLTNFFTDWKKMGESQEVSRAFQKEITKARKEGNTNRVNKLMKMQPEIMKRQTEASGGMMKPMFFLIIFIYPIFIWLRIFLLNLPHYYITVPWANQVSLFSWPFGFGQAWLWLYLIFSMVMGQLLRQGFKYISWTDRWKEFRERIRPTSIR
jgi:uncharacterized membrane protein (DUF106 family)